MGMISDVDSKSLDLNAIPVEDEVRIRDTNADTWYLKRVSPEEPLSDLIAGFTVRSTNPAWIRLMGAGPAAIHHICRALRVGQHFPIGGIDIKVAEIHYPN